MNNAMAKFMWIIARVDSRQYRQNSTELQPNNFWVGVEVPLTEEFIFNFKEILEFREKKSISELGYNQEVPDEPQPIHTAKALKFCLDKLGEYLQDEEVTPDDFKQEDGEDWSDNTTSTSSEPTESWGSDDEEGNKDEKWDDESEKWDG